VREQFELRAPDGRTATENNRFLSIVRVGRIRQSVPIEDMILSRNGLPWREKVSRELFGMDDEHREPDFVLILIMN